MPKPLQSRFFWLVFVVFLASLSERAFSQGCSGTTGAGITGGAISVSTGFLCANVDALMGPGSGAVININAGQVVDGDVVSFVVDWDDGTAPVPVIPTKTGPNTWVATNVTHYFPVTGPNVQCQYIPRVTLEINGSTCTTSFGTPPIFTRWNVDNENSGRLNLTETITDVNEYLVCKGAQTTVTFTDRSTLNCVPPELPPVNIAQRWRRFTYGTANTITSATGVQINGIFEAFPFQGAVITANPSQTPLPPTVTLPITIPADAQVGEIFEITMEYWNTCNPFPGTPVTQTARIRVVDQPLPPTATSQVYCVGNALQPFQITIGGTPIINWYEDNAGVPGNLITQGTSKTLAVSAYPPSGINNTTPGVYTVWASYYGVNNVDGVSCESPRIPISITIREFLPRPPIPAGATQFCNGSSFTLTLGAPATETIGGATEYVWTGDTGVTIGSTTVNSATFNINIASFGGADFVDRTVRVRRRFTTPPNCGSPDRDYTIRIYAPTVGGTLSAVPDICEGSDAGTINLTGQVGQVQRWEVSFNGGAFVPDGTLGTATSISPGILGIGTWAFRAVVANGTCLEEFSSVEDLEVFANPGTPVSVGPDQAFCQVSLTSNPLGGSDPTPGTGQWTKVSGPGSVVFNPDASTPNATATVSTQGLYVLRWTITNGLCVQFADIQVDFGTDPGPQDAGTPATFCGLTGNLNAVPPAIGVPTWTQVGGPGTTTFGDENSPTSSIDVTAFGVYTYQLTVTSGNCVPQTDQVQITFNQSATATAMADFTACFEAAPAFPPIDLTGTVAVTTNGRWEVVSGTGTIQSSGAVAGSDIAGPTINDRYVPSATDYTNGGTVTVRLVAIDPDGAGPCVQQTDDVVITIERRPSNVSAGADQPNVCADNTNLAALVPQFGTGMWSTTNASVFIVDPADPATEVQNLPVGVPVTFTWTVSSLGAQCSPVVDDVIITRQPLPTVLNINPATICEDVVGGPVETNNVDLTLYNDAITTLPAGNRTITWFDSGNNNLGTSPPLQNNIITGSLYTARVQNATTLCSNDGTITFSVTQLPDATNASVQVCEDNPAGSNTATGVNLIGDLQYTNAVIGTSTNVTVRWFNTFLGATNNDPADQISTTINVNGSRQVFARIIDNNPPNCFAVAQLNLVVKPLPTNVSIFGKSTVCVGDSSVPPDELPVEIYQVTPVSGAKYYWDIPDDPLSEFKVFGGGTENDFFVLLQFPNVFSGDIKVRVELNGCGGVDIVKTITVSDAPSAFSISGEPIVCENDIGIQYDVSPNNFPGSSYNWQITRASDNSPGGALVANGQTTGQAFVNFLTEDVNITVTESNSSNCIGPPQTLLVSVNQRPLMLDPSKEVCSDGVSGIVFQDAPTSPVPADRWDISSVSVTPGVIPKVGPTSGVVNTSTAISNDLFENPKAVPLPVRYTVTPISVDAISGKECPGNTQIVTLTVKPEPQLDPNLDKAICSDEETQITLVSAPNTFPADKFIVENINDGGLTFQNPPLPVIGTQLNSDAIFTNRWLNTTSSSVLVTYTIRPFSTVLGCAGDPPTDVRLTIHPQPQVTPVALPPVCSGDNLSIPLTTTNAVVGATFVWTVKTITGVSGAASGTGTTITGVLTNNSAVQGNVVYEVRAMNPASMGSCLGPPIDVQIFVNPSPQASPLVKAVCSDTPGGNTYTEDLTLIQTEVSTAPGVTFKWFEDQNNEATTVINTLNAYVLTNNTPIYVRVDNGICSKVVSVTYTVNPGVSLALSATNYNGVQLKCNNDNTGQIQSTASLGTPLYSFSIDGGPFVTTNQFTFLPAGLHTITARDAKGCTDVQDITLIEPPLLSAALVQVQPITCFLDKDAVIQTNATGGTGAYGYLLLQNPTNVTGVSNGIFTDISIGTYNVRVTDVNGCTIDTSPLTITQPTQVEGTASVVEDVNGFQLSCSDATDGEIDVQGTGGNGAAYTYTLVRTNDPVNDPNPYAQVTGTASESFSNLPYGNYTITVQDNKGCSSLPVIAVIVNPPPFEAGFVGVNQSVCSGLDPAKIEELVPPFGGVGQYVYQWQQSLTGTLIDADWSNIPGENQFEYDPPVLTQTTFFRRLVTSGSCETKGKDNIVKITVNPLPAATLTGPIQVCQGESFLLNMTLTTGKSPIEYDYTATTSGGPTPFLNLIGVDNTLIPITNFQEQTTFEITRIRDLNGCVAPPANLPAPIVVDVIKINSDFTILAPDAQCPGGTFNFEWQVEPDVAYTWLWSDNTNTPIAANALATGTNQIQHVFAGSSTQTSTIFPVTLQATNSQCIPKSTSKPITVFPNIALNILPGDTVLCSGQSVQFKNQSLGNDIDRWYYREQGTTDILDERTSKEVTYVMTNTTNNNPIHYEVIYEARNNEGCTASYMTTVRVYRAVNASFTTNPDPPPPYNGGASQITVTNTTTPANDLGHFEYTWDFGDNNANPPTGAGLGPFDVEYYSAGFKDIVLTVVNIEARDNNKVCRSIAVKQINIDLPAVGALFTVTPLESCLPVELVVDNQSPGADTFSWIVYNEFGQEIANSNLRDPTFTVNQAGVYTISLVAKYAPTNQTATYEVSEIKVYAKPAAIFDVRPTTVFVPDTELFTFNNSVRANTYFWDFGDGTESDLFQPTHTYRVEGKYTITLVSGFDHGMVDIDGDGVADVQLVCMDTASTEILAREGGLTKIPNAFTPNPNGPSNGQQGSGGFNDVFLPITRGVEEFTMQIFDRWGNLIFESREKNIGWDGYDRNGRLMPAGVYVYKLVLRLSNGERTTKIGDVTMIR